VGGATGVMWAAAAQWQTHPTAQTQPARGNTHTHTHTHTPLMSPTVRARDRARDHPPQCAAAVSATAINMYVQACCEYSAACVCQTHPAHARSNPSGSPDPLLHPPTHPCTSTYKHRYTCCESRAASRSVKPHVHPSPACNTAHLEAGTCRSLQQWISAVLHDCQVCCMPAFAICGVYMCLLILLHTSCTQPSNTQQHTCCESRAASRSGSTTCPPLPPLMRAEPGRIQDSS
jgi:hypothetical protein